MPPRWLQYLMRQNCCFHATHHNNNNSVAPQEPENDLFLHTMVFRVSLDDGHEITKCNMYVDGRWGAILYDHIAYIGVVLHTVQVGDVWTASLNEEDAICFQQGEHRQFVLRRCDMYTARLTRLAKISN
jgi:hypothetical protein